MIDKDKGYKALGALIAAKAVSPSDVDKYRLGVDRGLSYADVILAELGEEVGLRYLQEEYVQAIHFARLRLPFDTLSVPEVLLIENSDKEPWHKGKYSALSGPQKFQEEAAEPWHASLKSTFTPDPEVSLWFNNHPKFFDDAIRIQATVTGKRPPSEEDIAKLGAGR